MKTLKDYILESDSSKEDKGFFGWKYKNQQELLYDFEKLDDYIKTFEQNYEIEFNPNRRDEDGDTFYDTLSKFIIDNDLKVDDILSKFQNIKKYFNKSTLEKTIESFLDFKRKYQNQEKWDSLKAYAEEEMSRQGLSYDED